PGGRGRGGVAALRHRRPGGRRDPARRLRPARRPGAARHPGRRPHALQQAARAPREAESRARGCRRAPRALPRLNPMATNVYMEALSPTMEEGRVAKWHKRDGDAVKAGETLAEVETDKAIMDLVARADGVLRQVAVAEGQTVPVGSVVRRELQGAATVAASPPTFPVSRVPLPERPEGAYQDVPLTQILKTIAKRLATSLGPIPHFFLTSEVAMERAGEAREALNKQLGDQGGSKVSFNDIIIKATALA